MLAEYEGNVEGVVIREVTNTNYDNVTWYKKQGL